MLLLNKIKKIYSPCLVSVVRLAYFVVFGGSSGVCRSSLLAKSRLDTVVSKDLDFEAVYSPKFESAARFFPPTQRRIVHWSPYPVGLEKIFKLSAPIRTIFASLLELSTSRRSLLPGLEDTLRRGTTKATLAVRDLADNGVLPAKLK